MLTTNREKMLILFVPFAVVLIVYMFFFFYPNQSELRRTLAKLESQKKSAPTEGEALAAEYKLNKTLEENKTLTIEIKRLTLETDVLCGSFAAPKSVLRPSIKSLL